MVTHGAEQHIAMRVLKLVLAMAAVLLAIAILTVVMNLLLT